MAGSFEHLKHDSIRDVISILDTALLHSNELDPQYRAMQIANRALIAHHAIEKGLKARLEKEGISYPKSAKEGHDLHLLYKLTKQVNNSKWADGLANSYRDAVRFYEYDLELAPHVETLETYLAAVGSGSAFLEVRYWLENHSTADNSVHLMYRISLLLHREILEALWPLVAFDKLRLVSERVEQAVRMEVQRSLAYSPGTPSEQASHMVIQWLETQPSLRAALREAVQQDYMIEGVDELGRQYLRDAYERLSASDNRKLDSSPSADPAVSFYIGTCRDIGPGSQPQYPDAEIRVQWKDKNCTWAEVFTTAGQMLGFISKHIQNRWHVQSLWNAEGAFSKSLEDAKNWLIDRFCRQVTVSTDVQTRHAYIFSTTSFLPHSSTITDTMETDQREEFELSFWDERHDLQPGERVIVTMKFDEDSGVGDCLAGVISRVEKGKVWVFGRKWVGLVK